MVQRKFKAGALTLGLVLAAVSALMVFTWLSAEDSSDPESALNSERSGGPELTLQYPVEAGGASGVIIALPWPALVERSDVVVIGTVAGQSEYERSEVGSGVTAVRAVYAIEVEQYLKGSGPPTLKFSKTVANEYSFVEIFGFEAGSVGLEEGFASYVDDPHPLTEGARYILALRRYEGRFTGTAEPFRFRLEDGLAVAESTMPGLGSYLARQFPTRSEEAAVARVLALVAAPSQPPDSLSERLPD
ncbi:MAG: hypothetical protein IH957_11635 [Chloroflexi bacterium]|nr:hypothetical protein [Chloroflexota bacterium]